ncbi:hypothetical protein GCM10011512_16600 [Tersicoccus solisilvae]|uniref:DUF4126 domain-containing protein n=1 Tax=Tersicoccus solisilvae TaxID=1882339 RepID=A0ABQ1P3E6_9MICC|nr:DUF4126 domain-containing protein [Tersicoccus solisilvae]GGC90349.1 hypothetical protein GCM10011512_16600 [Tersicoccus solisilvae]
MEILTGAGLAASSGLNAYIPLLVLGLLDRFTDLVHLPPGFAWLSNGWVLVILGVLLVLEVVADKIPAVDTVNDWIQTLVRPTSGGIVFGAGSASQTATVTDPASFFTSQQWVPIVVGVVTALAVHIVKATARPVANAASLGTAAPVLSTAEDASAIALSVAAVLLPVLVLVVLVVAAVGLGLLYRGFRRRRRARAAA